MSDPADPSKARKGPPLKAMAPTIVVLALAVLWSLYWVVARSLAETRIETALAEMAADGVVLTCTERGLGGYPFRFTFDCKDAVLETPEIRYATSRIAATVQAYDPRRMIAELEGPALIEPIGQEPVGQEPVGQEPVAASWERLLVSANADFASLRAVGEDGADALDLLDEIGFSATGLTVERAGARVRSARFTAFARPAGSRDVEIAVTASDLVADGAGFDPVDLALRARAFALPPLDTPDLLPRWLGGGGALGIQDARIVSGDDVLRATGRIEATPNGLAEGRLDAALTDPAALAKRIPMLSLLSNGFLLAGTPATIDERDALGLQIELEAGVARIGFITLGALPRLF